MFVVRPSNLGCTWIVFRALPTIRVHPELDGRTLDIGHSLNLARAFYARRGMWICVHSKDAQKQLERTSLISM